MTAVAAAAPAGAPPARRTLAWAARAMNGQILQAGARGDAFAGVNHDSRAVAPDQLFFAFPGERVDGFDFAAQAAGRGAAGIVVPRARGVPAGCDGAAIIAVDDARRAMGDVARAARAEFRGHVVGVTGSNGKTTTKELCAAALSPLGAVCRTAGSFNTDVGLPVTIMSATGNEAAWVLEMAMRGHGEIATLAEIARPHVGVITNVGAAHLERLHSLADIARAKGELFAGLGPDGWAVLPATDPLITAQAAHVRADRRITFDGRSAGDVRVLEVAPAGAQGAVVRYAVHRVPLVVRLPLAGAHNATNGAAALAVAHAAGVAPIAAAAALEKVALPPHRSAMLLAGGRTILDDCYNANPASMSAAIATVVAAVGGAGGWARAFAVLGDMLEIGPDSEDLHRALGREAGVRLAGVVSLGGFAGAVADGARAAGLAADRARAAQSPEEAAAVVASWTAPGDWILVKASRGMRLERVVDALRGGF
jgi:UDP-N-acetylmuramoyl-tripeptide--D-alanyl-D-alanine ligase